MLTFSATQRIYLAVEPVDMRKSIDGLMALVRSSFGEDVYSGHLFVFVSRRGDRVKVLTFSRGGFILYYKRLEQGRFRSAEPVLVNGLLALVSYAYLWFNPEGPLSADEIADRFADLALHGLVVPA